LTVQLTAVSLVPVTDATYAEELPSVRLVGPARARVMPCPWSPDWGGAASATGRLLETAGLAALAAVIVTVEDCGAEFGAT
jgi:hypothetical protein